MEESYGAGKGDNYRSVNMKIYSKNWDKIFNTAKRKKKKLTKTKKKVK